MRQRTGQNVFVALGLVLLVVGGIGFVYGQLTVQETAQTEGSGGLLDVSTGDGGGESGGLAQDRLIRAVGFLVGVVGVVLAFLGGIM